MRRIPALTGHGAVEYIQRQRDLLDHVAAQLSTAPDQVEDRVTALQSELTQAKKQAAQLQRQVAKQNFDALLGKLEQVNGKQALIAREAHDLSGLIVDYNGMLKSLRAALAQYALGDDGAGGEEIVGPIEERVQALLEAIEATEAHLRGLGFDPVTLICEYGFVGI